MRSHFTRTNYLQHYRRRHGLTQRQVARLVGYFSPSDMADFERGRRLPSLVAAVKLAVLYRVPVEFLFPRLYLEQKAQLDRRHGRRG